MPANANSGRGVSPADDLWLHGGAEDPAGLTRPYPAQDMKIVRKGGKLDDPAIASDPAPAQLRLL